MNEIIQLLLRDEILHTADKRGHFWQQLHVNKYRPINPLPPD